MGHLAGMPESIAYRVVQNRQGILIVALQEEGMVRDLPGK